MVRKVPNTDEVTFFADTDWEETVVCLWVVSIDCVLVSEPVFSCKDVFISDTECRPSQERDYNLGTVSPVGGIVSFGVSLFVSRDRYGGVRYGRSRVFSGLLDMGNPG